MRFAGVSKDGRGSRAMYALAALVAVAVAVGVCARFYHLGFPPGIVWDETYFPVMARKYLEGVPFFDLHPPLGKFILALGILAFGDNAIGWRVMPALFGCAMIGLGAATGYSLGYTRERVGALLMAAFLSCETVFVTYSRLGLMDGILVFFTLATFLAALLAEERKHVVWVAILLGLTISVKWAALMVAVPAGYVLWRKGLFRQFFGGLCISAIIYLAIVYVGQLVNPTGAGERFVEARGLAVIGSRWELLWNWHLQVLDNLTNAVENSAASPWWSWPMMLNPMNLFREVSEGAGYLIIYAIGNPVLWWSSTLAVVIGLGYLVYRKAISKEPVADHPLVPLLLGYAFLLLPWVPGTRIPYLYNYFPSYAFALLTLAYFLSRLWQRGRWGPWTVVAFVALVLAVGAYFLPIVMALPVSPEGLQRRMWLESWN